MTASRFQLIRLTQPERGRQQLFGLAVGGQSVGGILLHGKPLAVQCVRRLRAIERGEKADSRAIEARSRVG
jgi:hypothetical protein